MRFSTLAVLVAVAPLASSFAPSIHRQSSALGTALKKAAYDFDGLDKLDFPKPAPEPEKRTLVNKETKVKQAPKPTPAPAPKAEKKANKTKQAPEPTPPPKPEKVTKQIKKVVKAAAPIADPLEAKIQSLKPDKKKSSPKKLAPPAPIKSTGSKSADSNAVPLGVALGGAPLLLAPIVALGAGRSILSKTQARRAAIQQEIAEAERARKKKQLDAEVNGSDLAKALVRKYTFEFDAVLCFGY